MDFSGIKLPLNRRKVNGDEEKPDILLRYSHVSSPVCRRFRRTYADTRIPPRILTVQSCRRNFHPSAIARSLNLIAVLRDRTIAIPSRNNARVVDPLWRGGERRGRDGPVGTKLRNVKRDTLTTEIRREIAKEIVGEHVYIYLTLFLSTRDLCYVKFNFQFVQLESERTHVPRFSDASQAHLNLLSGISKTKNLVSFTPREEWRSRQSSYT